MKSGCKYHGDCFSCPYADCILDELEAVQADAKYGISQEEKKRSPRYEYNHRRYMARRETEKEKQKIYRARRKAGLPQKEGNKTADWNEYQRKYREAHREEIRAKKRRYYYEHHTEMLEAGRKYREKKRREKDEMCELQQGNRQAADNLQVSG